MNMRHYFFLLQTLITKSSTTLSNIQAWPLSTHYCKATTSLKTALLNTQNPVVFSNGAIGICKFFFSNKK